MIIGTRSEYNKDITETTIQRSYNMRNKLISIIAICMSFSLLTGCGSGQAKGSGSEEPAMNTAESAQEVTEDAEQNS